MRWKNYRVMRSTQETIQRLAEAPGRARVVAGGTDLMVQMSDMDAREESLTLLDVTRIEEMRTIRETDSHILIGAAVTMAELAASPLIQAKARALAQGAGWLGSPQIRNVATIGGNVVSAQPAADTSVPLVAFGAEAYIQAPDGEGYRPVEGLFRGIGESSVNPSWELITHFRLPACRGPWYASAMQRLAKRKAFTLPQLSVSVLVVLDEAAERFERVRIVAAPVAPTPWRAMRAEESLSGGSLTRDNVNMAAELARQGAAPRDSLRGGAAYRKDMVAVLTRRALLDALSQLNKVPQ